MNMVFRDVQSFDAIKSGGWTHNCHLHGRRMPQDAAASKAVDTLSSLRHSERSCSAACNSHTEIRSFMLMFPGQLCLDGLIHVDTDFIFTITSREKHGEIFQIDFFGGCKEFRIGWYENNENTALWHIGNVHLQTVSDCLRTTILLCISVWWWTISSWVLRGGPP